MKQNLLRWSVLDRLLFYRKAGRRRSFEIEESIVVLVILQHRQ